MLFREEAVGSPFTHIARSGKISKYEESFLCLSKSSPLPPASLNPQGLLERTRYHPGAMAYHFY